MSENEQVRSIVEMRVRQGGRTRAITSVTFPPTVEEIERGFDELKRQVEEAKAAEAKKKAEEEARAAEAAKKQEALKAGTA
jgi:membrane protein involved in colicin uptake